ncbi:hypothetical protein [Streptomyces sp. NPDC002521]
MIGWRFHKSYTLHGVRKLLIRHGFLLPGARQTGRGMRRGGHLRLGEGDLVACGSTAAARSRTPVIRVRGRTSCRLPASAPEFNRVEGIWPLLRRGYTANVAFTSTDGNRTRLPSRITHDENPSSINSPLVGQAQPTPSGGTASSSTKSSR